MHAHAHLVLVRVPVPAEPDGADRHGHAVDHGSAGAQRRLDQRPGELGMTPSTNRRRRFTQLRPDATADIDRSRAI